ncbi:MAG TPA: hypothetical protein VNV16_00080, partial [Methylibium sp.]|nr:hypothetical protein [Methylibium sp.]
MNILIRHGRVVDPASGRDERADVAIAAGRIIAIGAVGTDFEADRTIDAGGLVVAPGLVDLAARGDRDIGALIATRGRVDHAAVANQDVHSVYT